MNEILFDLLLCIISLLSILFAKYMIPYVKARIEESEYANLLEIIDIAVRAMEQTLQKSGMGAEKKKRVIAFVSSWLKDKGVRISEDQLDKLIEAAVYNMKHEVDHG